MRLVQFMRYQYIRDIGASLLQSMRQQRPISTSSLRHRSLGKVVAPLRLPLCWSRKAAFICVWIIGIWTARPTRTHFWFSILDLTAAYNQVPIIEKDKMKTGFCTIIGLFKWNGMLFGLCNVPSTFQKLMERISGDEHCQSLLLFLDDVVVFSSTVAEHMECLDAVLGHLSKRVSKQSWNSTPPSDQRRATWAMSCPGIVCPQTLAK